MEQSRADAKAVQLGYCDLVAASKRTDFLSQPLRSAEFDAVARSQAQVTLQTGEAGSEHLSSLQVRHAYKN